MKSIRLRLMVSLLALWTIIWGAIALLTVERSAHEVAELLDAELAQMAQVLRAIGQLGNLADLGTEGQSLAGVDHPYETRISFQLWDGEALLARLGAAPQARLADRLGFTDQVIGTHRWRVFGARCGDSGRVLYVAQDYGIRRELISGLTFNTLLPIVWSLPLALLLVWLAVSDGLRPLARVARAVEARSDRRLEPISDSAAPAEVRPLIAALNDLMRQVRSSLTLERRFSADASHELRTPMASIHTYAQIARQARDPAEREQALERISRGVARATRVVEQILALSRIRPERFQQERSGGTALRRIVEEVLADRLSAAQAAGVRIEQRLPSADPCMVGMPASMLGILVANLIDNAIKFTPRDGVVRVDVDPLDADIRLSVSDNGPGIPAAQRQRVFRRFHRGPGQDEPGAGLGLSIVQRICDVHGARIRLDDAQPDVDGPAESGPGLRVEVLIPRLLGAASARNPGTG